MAEPISAGSTSRVRAAAAPWVRRAAGSRALGLAGLVLFVFAFQGSRGIFEPDEGRYTAVALQMLRTGEWIQPALHHEIPHYTKPPLTYWLMAAGVALFGHHEWAVRLPHGLAFAGMVLLVFAMARRLQRGPPEIAAVVLAGMLLPFVASNLATTDAVLALWETAAVAAFVEWRWGTGQRRGDWLLAMWAAFGLAFLTKGPAGLLPLAALALFTATADGAASLRRLFRPLGVLLFLVVGTSWFVWVIVLRPELAEFFLGGEVLARIASDRFDRHGGWRGAFEVYGPALLGGTLPWTGFLLAGAAALARRAWRDRRRGRLGVRWLAACPERTLLLVWFALPMTVFALAQSRQPLYVLPLTVPLALLATPRVARWLGGSRRRWLTVGTWLVLLIAVRGLAGHVPHSKDSRALAAALRAQVPVGFDEVLFVDTWPRYGVDFYFDAEAEAVTLRPWPKEAGALAPRETYGAELRERERWVVVVEADELEGFLRETAEQGYRPLPRGGWNDLRFFTLRPQR